MDIQSRNQLLESADFRQLVTRRWRVSLWLTLCLFFLYYGYVLLIALNRSIVTSTIGANVPLGIPLGAAVIVGAWVLTALYVVWANRRYDPEVARLLRSVR